MASKLASNPCVLDHPTSIAAEFLDALSPREEPWSEDPEKWIYRGQADANWKLQATAARNPRAFEPYGVPSSCADWSDRKHCMDQILERFRQLLNESGVPIPVADPPIVRKNLYSSNAEPLPEAFPLMALAQHHGLPTLLLDWTRRAWVAAYFAAVEVAAQLCDRCRVPKAAVSGHTHLAVWALRRDSFDDIRERVVHEAPGATNPNLHAQAGLFTLQDPEQTALEEWLVELREKHKELPMIHRVSLPVAEAPKLLKLLSHEGINGATMFPGTDGVVRAMRERTLWT